MDYRQDTAEILALVQDRKNWNPELYERIKRNLANSPRWETCIFNRIRKVLSEEDYENFDFAYCVSGRPQDAEVILFTRKERKQKEGEEKWRTERAETLKRITQIEREIKALSS